MNSAQITVASILPLDTDLLEHRLLSDRNTYQTHAIPTSVGILKMFFAVFSGIPDLIWTPIITNNLEEIEKLR